MQHLTTTLRGRIPQTRIVSGPLACLAIWSVSFVASAEPKPIDLLVVRDGWGDVRRDTVEKVLQSTAAELWKYFPDRKLPPIIVQPRGGPITLFQRGPGGEIFIRLNTGQTYWSQYAYQFAHELCHVLCKYDRDKTGNKWFEESICETGNPCFAIPPDG